MGFAYDITMTAAAANDPMFDCVGYCNEMFALAAERNGLRIVGEISAFRENDGDRVLFSLSAPTVPA